MTMYDFLKTSDRKDFEKILVATVLAFGDAQLTAVFQGLEDLCNETKVELNKKFGENGDRLNRFIDECMIPVFHHYKENIEKITLSEEHASDSIKNMLNAEIKEK